MFVALWEYEVKPGGEERFENGYGPGGEPPSPIDPLNPSYQIEMKVPAYNG